MAHTVVSLGSRRDVDASDLRVGPTIAGIRTYVSGAHLITADGKNIISAVSPDQRRAAREAVREFFSRHSEAEISSKVRAKLAGDSLTLDDDRPSSAAAYTKIGQRVDASANAAGEPPKVETAAQQSVVAPNFASQQAHANAVPASGPAQWTQSDIAALTSSDVQGLTASQLASLSPTQISWFSPAQVAAFSSAQLNGLSVPQVGALTASQVDTLTQAQFSGLNASFVASLTYQQLNALTTAQTQSLSATQLQALSGTQVASIVNPNFAALSGTQFSSLSSPALQSLQAFQIASFSKAQISGLTSQAIASFTTSQINAFSPYQISLLSNAQTQALTTAQVQGLSAAATSGLTGAQLNALTTAQVQSLTATQLSALSGAQVASLVNPNFSALSGAQFSQLSTTALQSLQPFQIVSLSGAQLAGLTPSSVASFTSSQINAFSSYAISLFSNAQIQALTTSQIQGLSASSVSGLTGAQLNALTTTQVQALTATQLQALSGAQASSLVNPNFAALTGAQFSQLSTTALQSLQSFQISSFSGVQISGLTPTAVAAFTPAQVSVFTPYALSLLNNAQTQALTSAQLNALNASQTNALLPSQLKVLTPQQVSGLSNAVIATLSGNQFDALSVSALQALLPGQIRTLSGNQVSSLSVQTVASFTPSQYAALSSTALSALTPAQAQALSIGQLDALRGGLLPTTGPLQNLGNNASYLEVAPNFYAYTPNGAGVTGVGAFGPTLAAAEAFAGGGNNAYAAPNGGEQYFIATDAGSPTGQIYGYTADNAGQTGRFAYGLSEDAAKQTFLSAFGAPPSSTQSGSLSDLSPAALASIAPSLIATLNPAELTGLSYAQLGSLTVAQLSALSSQQLAAVNSSILQSAGPVQGLGNNTAEVQYAANVVAFTSNGSGGTGIGAYGPDLATAEAYANQNIAYNAPNGSPEFVVAADASSPTGILYTYIGDGAGGIGNGAYGLSLASAKQAFLNAYGPGPGLSTGSFLSLDQIANLSAAQVAALSPTAIGQFTAQQLQALPHFDVLNALQIASIVNTEGLSSVQTSQIAASNAHYLTQQALANFSASGVSGLQPPLVKGLSGQQLNWITNFQALTPEQTSQFTPDSQNFVTIDQVASLSAQAIDALGTVFGYVDQPQGVKAKQLGMSDQQIKVQQDIYVGSWDSLADAENLGALQAWSGAVESPANTLSLVEAVAATGNKEPTYVPVSGDPNVISINIGIRNVYADGGHLLIQIKYSDGYTQYLQAGPFDEKTSSGPLVLKPDYPIDGSFKPLSLPSGTNLNALAFYLESGAAFYEYNSDPAVNPNAHPSDYPLLGLGVNSNSWVAADLLHAGVKLSDITKTYLSLSDSTGNYAFGYLFGRNLLNNFNPP